VVAASSNEAEDRRVPVGPWAVADLDSWSEDRRVAVGSLGVVVVVDSSSSEDRRVEVRWWSEGKQAAAI
jgi:hypothetical protein